MTGKKDGGQQSQPKAETVEDMERKLHQLADDAAERRKSQDVIDMRAEHDAVVEHGVGRVTKVELNAHIEGMPVVVLARPQTRPEQKRYDDMVVLGGKASYVKASKLLANSCRIYPSAEVFQQMVEADPGIETTLGNRLVARAQGKRAVEEKD